MLQTTPGIYCWTDASRAEHIFKLGMSNDLLFRLEQERCETSNTGTLLFHFILECEEGQEKAFEKWAKQWLKEKKARLCDHGFQVNANKEWYKYPDMEKLLAYCKTFPYYTEMYSHVDELPTSWAMLPKRIKDSGHFNNLPDGIKSAFIKQTDKKELSQDIEYTKRKQYFSTNRVTLEQLIDVGETHTSITAAHSFEFVKNKDHNTLTQSKYKLSDFIHDLETKRIKISPCCGCYPIFQPNQLAHLDGCLSCSTSEEEYDM